MNIEALMAANSLQSFRKGWDGYNVKTIKYVFHYKNKRVTYEDRRPNPVGPPGIFVMFDHAKWQTIAFYTTMEHKEVYEFAPTDEFEGSEVVMELRTWDLQFLEEVATSGLECGCGADSIARAGEGTRHSYYCPKYVRYN